ncbi:MAG: thioredoxin [Bacteroidetes bacterium GWF2_42_66]|nr:MAG: thioredoxin [Bacteroidetes bacterium GWA2_42_15]OFX96346.1 MAG: thioredoxin [Bacteroidetes bacterium GWE2_42_39]OFY46385.1 MAG: thioredoxin [Bacteroidetes bacterium GWF2_42_66]HBL78229.1 thioredoxin [Prolixibacteraceae bacterium]HCR89933.1 thioredoxin [Prolixibacteraceae bacterium]
MHERFKNIINSDKPVLVDFYADWCRPCKLMPPILKEVKDRFKENIRIIKVNVDRHPAIVSRYQIQNIPAVLIFQNGEVRWNGVGVQSAEVLSNQIRLLV